MVNFKVGDKVKIVLPNSAPSKYIGQTGTIREIESQGSPPIKVKFSDGEYWWYKSSDLMPTRKENGFKVGDRVKLRDYSVWGDHEKHDGQIGIVDKVEKTLIHIRWNDGVSSNIYFAERSLPYKVKKASHFGVITSKSLRLY